MEIVIAVYGLAASPAGALKLHGVSMAAWLALGAACKMGSTPLNNVITVPPDNALPSVETIITASPFCRSRREAAGIRPSIC